MKLNQIKEYQKNQLYKRNNYNKNTKIIIKTEI